MSTPENRKIVLFDGACPTCCRAAAFVEDHDSHANFDLVAIDSEKGLGLCQALDFQTRSIDSLYLIDDGRMYVRSAAVLRVLKELPGFQLLYYLLKIVPRPFRDWCYDLIARNRHLAAYGRQREIAPENATAALLLELAGIDSEFSEREKNAIYDLLKTRFHLSDHDVSQILAASRQQLDQKIDLYYFTSLINDNFDISQKIAVMEMMWQVIYADGQLDGYEDFLVHRYAKLLRLDHRQMIAAKLKIKSEMGIE
jgi:predicted DCC family thiol-disulfide oxidoreductase YuxK